MGLFQAKKELSEDDIIKRHTTKRFIHIAVMWLFMQVSGIMATLIFMYIEAKDNPAYYERLNSEALGQQLSEVLNSNLVMATLVANLIFLLPYLIRDIIKKENYIKKINIRHAVLLISGAVIFNIFVTWIINMFPQAEAEVSSAQDSIINSNLFLAILSIGIITPIAEETFFRRTIVNAVKMRNFLIAIILSGVIFSISHDGTIQRIYAAVFGVFFAFLYARTENLTYTIIPHIIINTTSTIFTAYQDELMPLVVPAFILSVIVFTIAVLYPKFSPKLNSVK